MNGDDLRKFGRTALRSASCGRNAIGSIDVRGMSSNNPCWNSGLKIA